MTIPERLQPPEIPQREIHEYCAICTAIEDGVHRGKDIDDLLEKWNARTHRQFEAFEFTTYCGAISTEEFVEEALLQKATLVEDITFEELRAVLDELLSGELAVPQHSYYLTLLEENLPDSNLSDLIYWPDAWFKDKSLLQTELTPDQILRYAIQKSTREIPCPPAKEPLPYPIPSS